ncbi:ATP-binding protein [Sulfurimonas sp.]|uniref:ATP-binding protein n=1 Tax=Sulfurimonas sp. TaxID=2022749 RepID=UPI0039E3299F
MFNFIKKSLRNKLLSIFIIIGFLPFLTLLSYILFFSETKILSTIILQHSNRAKNVTQDIHNDITSLMKEVHFLSTLDLMDDLIVEDIDKRVSRLLIQKSKDLNIHAEFMVISQDSIVIASSNKEIIHHKKELHIPINLDEGMFLKKNQLYFFSKITASFDTANTLGVLILKYNLENLNSYLTNQGSIHSYIINSKNKFSIGKKISLDITYNHNVKHIINDSYVIVYEELPSVLNDFNIIYAVDKNIALEFLYDFITFMFYISIIIFLVIIYTSIKLSRDIVKPIEELTTITDNITTTNDYKKRLTTTSQDEIATLARSFNAMLKTTSSALTDLEKENKLRLQRFTQLISIFNTIIQTKSEDECIEISMEEIRKLTKKNDLFFHQNKNISESKRTTDLYVTDFENDQKIYFGSIALIIHEFKDKNEQDFYKSIASMISLQLDRIRSTKKIISASNAKSSFISNMSHELRTPLNAIMGSTQYMITYESLSDDQLDTVSTIESSAQYLLNMINEILDIAKIEAGKMEVYVQKVDIAKLFENIKDILDPLALDKDLKLSFHSDNLKSTYFETDPKIFQQIMINLISNSIKFTQKGSISINVEDIGGHFCIYVKDTGIGISKNNIKELFNDFTQIDNTMQIQNKGTGLGLSFSQKMAKLLNGTIILKSDGIGHGTICTFSLSKKGSS